MPIALGAVNTATVKPRYDANGIPLGANSGGNPFDLAGYKAGLAQSADSQRSALNSIFGARKAAGVQDITDTFNKQRGDTIDEQGALGSRLLSRSGQASVANVDAQKNKALASLFTGLQGEQGQAQVSTENNILDKLFSGTNAAAGFGLQQQGLNQNANQFAANYGLQSDTLEEAKRKALVDEMLTKLGIETAGNTGRLQAEANKPKTTDYLNTVANLLTGGAKLYTAFA